MKKTLVVLLALMMVFAFATTAMAADEQYVPYADIADQDVDIQTAIERLTILGALTGYDAEGTKYAPAQLITREEFATIGVRIAGLEDQVALYASMASAFKDVEEGRWSEGYINAANANGIMIGRGNGVFDPKANVTMQEVTTVLLRAVGYDDRLPGAWPSDYNTKAVNVGLTEYVDYIGPKAATRGEVASLANEAVDLNMVEYVGNDIAAGIGQAFGDVDKDGYMYVVLATNEGKVNTDLLMHSFDASTEEVTFWDETGDYSEAFGWGFDDFGKWELVAKTVGKNTTKVDVEFASLYGISKGQDVTDLGWQTADVTLNSKGEIIYVDLTSEIKRITDITEKTIAALDYSDFVKGEYGEIWYDADGDAYYGKDFGEFAKVDFGIVDDVDEDGVYFKGKPAFSDLDLDDNYAFYLEGEGFIAAEDLEEGDVVYLAENLVGADGLAIVYRPVSASFDDYGRKTIEIDDVEYNVEKNYSYVSYDQGSSFEVYDYDDILSQKLQFSNKVAFVPAYAFVNFAYFADDVQHAGAGILDHYVISGGEALLNGNTNAQTISGMYVLHAGDKEPTLVEFEKNVKITDDIKSAYPTEGSYIEYAVNADGEFVISGTNSDKGFTAMHKWEVQCGDKTCGSTNVVAKWKADNTKLNISIDGTADNYSLANNAVIYLVESDADIYDRDSAQALTLDEFKKKGDFTAAEICIFNAKDTIISTLYIRDIQADGEVAYGFGLFEKGDFKNTDSKTSYALIDGEKVYVDRDAAYDVEDKLNTATYDQMLVAYRTEDGKIVDKDDVIIIDCSDTGNDFNDLTSWSHYSSFTDKIGYNMICGTVDKYDASVKQLTIKDAKSQTDADASLTYDMRTIKNGYDFNSDTAITKVGQLDGILAADQHVLIVYNEGDNAMYLFVFTAEQAGTLHS